jgi:hypothetical protein
MSLRDRLVKLLTEVLPFFYATSMQLATAKPSRLRLSFHLPPTVTFELRNKIAAVMDPPAGEAPPILIEITLALPVAHRASASPNRDSSCPSTCRDLSAPSLLSSLPQTRTEETVAITEPATEESPPVLSAIEKLPTEVIQHVASCLIYEDLDLATNELIWYSDDKQRYASDGICELRSSSKTLRAKTRHVFSQCFEVIVVTFRLYTLTRLVQLSQSPYSPLV